MRENFLTHLSLRELKATRNLGVRWLTRGGDTTHKAAIKRRLMTTTPPGFPSSEPAQLRAQDPVNCYNCTGQTCLITQMAATDWDVSRDATSGQMHGNFLFVLCCCCATFHATCPNFSPTTVRHATASQCCTGQCVRLYGSAFC